MANTDPVADNATITDNVYRTGREVGLVDVHPVSAVTVGLAGANSLPDGHDGRRRALVKMFSDDGKCVDDPLLMRRALEYATGLGVLIAQHAEEPRLTVGAVAHGVRLPRAWAWPAGRRARPRSPSSRVTRCWPVTPVRGSTSATPSTAGTVELPRWAEGRGIAISAGDPHHLLLHRRAPNTYDGINRVNPPLRGRATCAGAAGRSPRA